VVNETLKRWLVLGGLLLLTIWLVLNAPVSENDSEVVAVNPSRSSKLAAMVSPKVMPENIGDELALKHRIKNDEKIVDIFGTQQKVIIVNTQPVIKVKPQIKLTAPRLPFKYIGKLVENNVTKLFLMEGEALHIVSEGDRVGSNYQLNKVEDKQISLLYLPLKITQTMSIGKAL